MAYNAEIRVHTAIDNAEIKNTEKEIERLAKKLDAVRQRSVKLEVMGGTSKQLASLGYDAEILEAKLAEAGARLEQLKASSATATTATGFTRLRDSAKKCFSVIDTGAKKNNKNLGSTRKVLQNILLSMIAFQAIFKGAEFVASGFKNLVQYSSELNGVFSDLKSETATLKNSLATAFAPVVQMIIPYLTQLISWLNTAMNALSQFWAYLGGKNTYTRAKKQVVDYAKSIKEASGTAKGALASFDELNVLSKNEGADAGGEVGGADAFEEVEVDKDKFAWVDWVKENLDMILEIVGMIGAGLLAWKIASMFTKDFGLLAGIIMTAAGAFLFAKNAVDAWTNGVDWSNITGMMTGAAIAIAGLAVAFGSVGAAIGAAVAGVAMVVVGIHDIMENGVNLKNGILIVAGVFMTLLTTIGAVAAGIGAVITALVLAIVADWENFKESVMAPLEAWFVSVKNNYEKLTNGIKQALNGIITFITGVFTGNWKMAWTGIGETFSGIWNTMVATVQAAVNLIAVCINTVIRGIEGAINAVVAAINSINFTVPAWVPVIGGQQFGGFNLPSVDFSQWQIPYLATGGIVTSSTLANIGEAGKEAVLPLENNTEWMDILSDKINDNRGPVVIKFEGSLAELGRVLKPVIDTENSRVGNNFALG